MPETNPVFCDDCGQVVRMERTEYRNLKATCACGEVRNVKISSVIPEGWE